MWVLHFSRGGGGGRVPSSKFKTKKSGVQPLKSISPKQGGGGGGGGRPPGSRGTECFKVGVVKVCCYGYQILHFQSYKVQ